MLDNPKLLMIPVLQKKNIVKLRRKKKRKKKEQPLSTSFIFKTVISSVLNVAGKLTSIFGFQQARYDEREADCRPGG